MKTTGQFSRGLIFDLLDALSPTQREVIRLKFQSNLSYREIADLKALSLSDVGSLLHAAMKNLCDFLRENPLKSATRPTP